MFYQHFESNETNVKNLTKASLEADVIWLESKLAKYSNSRDHRLLVEKDSIENLCKKKSSRAVNQI